MQPYSEKAEGGYIRNRVISNDQVLGHHRLFPRRRDARARTCTAIPAPSRSTTWWRASAWASTAQRNEQRCGPGSVVYFDAGEPHNIHSAPGSDALVYRVQIGADRSVKRPA